VSKPACKIWIYNFRKTTHINSDGEYGLMSNYHKVAGTKTLYFEVLCAMTSFIIKL